MEIIKQAIQNKYDFITFSTAETATRTATLMRVISPESTLRRAFAW